jgi:PAS domain S-box-containing protein
VCLAISTIPIGIIGGIQGFQSESMMLIGLIFLVTFVVSLTISYFITRPIEKLTDDIDKISKGKLDVNLEPSEIYEINNLTDSLNRVMTSLKLAIHKVGVKKGEIFEDAVKAKEAVEKKQDDLINSITGWAWETDARGVYTFCSRNVSDLLGYKPEELIGKSVFDFMSSEDVKKTKQVFNEASKNKKPIRNLENWNVTKNGEMVCIIANGNPFFDEAGNLLGYRGIDTNITREKRAESKIDLLNKELEDLKMEITELLNEREERKGNGLEPIGIKTKKLNEKWSEHEFDSVFLFDENANILDCNENMHKRLGYSKSEMLSLNMADFDALETKQDIVEKINKAKKNGVYSFKTIHKRKDGSSILVHENLQYLKDKNTFKCIVREDYSHK